MTGWWIAGTLGLVIAAMELKKRWRRSVDEAVSRLCDFSPDGEGE